jgi:FkbM family methyltransferase
LSSPVKLKTKLKVLLRSRSLAFTRDYAARGVPRELRTYTWQGVPVSYRTGTSDAGLIYSILLKRGAKSEYALPAYARLDPSSVKTVLDIGANIGVAAIFFCRQFPNAEVHAFEPEPGNCEVLRANAAASSRIRLHPFALGAEDGELTLFHSADAGNEGGFGAHNAAGIDTGRAQTVPVRHSGRALEGLGIHSVDVIKIDTEGAEWEILTSLDAQMLRSVRVIMGELHGRRDFALLDFLQDRFHIGARKNIHNRLFNFYAVNRQQALSQ